MQGKIYEDTRQQVARGDKHELKHSWFAAHDVMVVRKKLDFGDYAADGSNVVVDTKRNVGELAMDVGRDHARFVREMERARDAGYRLIILVESGKPYDSLDSLYGWTSSACRMCRLFKTRECNPREVVNCLKYHRKPMQGVSVAKICKRMEERYDCRFVFVHPAHAAATICKLLGVAHS